MHLIGGLDTPTAGEIMVDGLPLHRASDAELTAYRRTKIGIVFQFFQSAADDERAGKCLPAAAAARRAACATARAKADEIIDLVGLSDRARHGMHQLSGGQLQRTAIARALVHDPAVLLADEPTGNLDSANAAQIMELLQKISSQRRTTMLVVTHSEEIARQAARRIRLRDGKIFTPPMSNSSEIRSKLQGPAFFSRNSPRSSWANCSICSTR